MGKKVIVLFLAIVILGSLYCECAKGDLFGGPVTRGGGDFTVTIKSPMPDETINGAIINLNFSINDTGVLWLVRSISYTVYLDGEMYNQTQENINSKTAMLLDKTLTLQNVSKGQHTIEVNATVDYDFYSITWGGPYDARDTISGSVGFSVYYEEKDLNAGQPTDNSTSFPIVENVPTDNLSNIAIAGGAIAITIVISGSYVWFKKSKSKVALK
jgi:hypothetical protein